MGWTVRKSFKLGPTRIKFSSRGIGASVGVKGLRFGSSGGRGYVSADRGMFRYRSSVGGGRAGRAVQSQMLAAGAAAPSDGRSCLQPFRRGWPFLRLGGSFRRAAARPSCTAW